MIEATVARLHQHLRAELPGGLDELLHDDVVFFSPVVFTPQRGKEITKRYLEAAGATLGADPKGPPRSSENPDADDSSGGRRGFRYVTEVLSGNHAVLEFETEMGGKYINGIDLITCDDDGKIIEFKVMIRPLQAVNVLHDAMRAMLEQLPPVLSTPES